MLARMNKDNLVVLGIVTVLTLTYVLVVYRHQSGQLESVNTQAAQTRLRMDQDANKAKTVPPMVREIQTMKQRYNNDWDRRLPQSKELSGFLREIAANLSQSNLTNEMIQPGNPTRGNLYNRLPITMKFEGDFLALANFLKRADLMARLTRVDNLTIVPSDKGESLNIEMGMNIYFTEQ